MRFIISVDFGLIRIYEYRTCETSYFLGSYIFPVLINISVAHVLGNRNGLYDIRFQNSTYRVICDSIQIACIEQS